MIEVRLFATLRENRGKILYVRSEEFSTGTQLIHHLGIEEKEIAIFLINGIHSQCSSKINDKDVIAIFPPVGGG